MTSLSPDGKGKLDKLLEQDEGFRQFSYHDSKGILSIGFGFNLEANGVPRPVAEFWLNYILDQIEPEISNLIPIYSQLNEARRIVLLNIGYNCGVQGLMEFRRLIAALNDGDFVTAAKEIQNSHLADNRKERLALFMEKGEL